MPDNNDNMPLENQVRTIFFPIRFVSHIIGLVLALVLGTFLYWSITSLAYKTYKGSLSNAQIIENILSDHGISDTTSKKKFSGRLTPRDFSIIMIAAGIEEERDLETADAIMNIRKTKHSGSWLTNAILDTEGLNGDPLSKLFLRHNIKKGCDAASRVGSLASLIKLYSKLGNNDHNGNAKTNNDCAVYKDQVISEAKKLVDRLAGPAPWFIPFLDKNPEFIVQNIIKEQMNAPWNLYKEGTTPSDSNKINTYTFDGSSYKELDKHVSFTDTKWYKKEPEMLHAGIFKLSKLVIAEVLRDTDVRTSRFFYKAFKGWIQWALIVFIIYIGLLLFWRYLATKSEPTKGNIWPPTLFQGKLQDIEKNALASRAFIDQLISTTPLLGLFGTVTGIMLGLPEAAKVVTGGSSDVSALFEQLGLAFSTTAIAIMGVIILEILWEKLQAREDKIFWEKQNSNAY